MAAVRLAQSLARAFETGRPDLALFEPPTTLDWAAIGQIDDSDESQ
jgi:CRISP-associated protein Cas1